MNLSYLTALQSVSNHPPLEVARVARTTEEKLEILIDWAKSGLQANIYAAGVGIPPGTLCSFKVQYNRGALGHSVLVDEAIEKNLRANQYLKGVDV